MTQNRHTTRWLVLLALLVSLQANAFAVRRPRQKLAVSEIRQLEDQWRSAQLAGDVQAMDRLLSDDFLGITAGGQVVTKLQQLDRTRTQQFVVKQLDVQDTKIKLIGSIAIVTSLATVEGMSEGKTMHGNFRYTRVYQRLANGAWKITSFEATHAPHGQQVEVAGQ